jgi:hypothetical protein
MMRIWLALVVLPCCVLGLRSVGAGEFDTTAADEQLLKRANLGTDSDALLDFFRKRTLSQVDQERIKQWVVELGDDSFPVREKASAALIEQGVAAMPLLRAAFRRETDPEVLRRVQACLDLLNRRNDPELIDAASRLLATRRPADTAAVLLAYLPLAEDEGVADEVRATLAAVAIREGKADPTLQAALTDSLPGRRAAAGEALCRAGLVDEQTGVHKLLQDPEPVVRLRVAMALVHARDKQAVPVLLDLLTTLPHEQARPVEDFLYWLAEESGPHVALGENEDSRRQCRDAWSEWWEKNGDKIDPARLETYQPTLGYTLIILLDEGRIIDLDANNNIRFQLDGLNWPLDAQMLPHDHVLVAEHNGNVVTERNRKGEIVWKKEIPGPIMAQRLPNGNTFIGTRTMLTEVTHDGKPVFSYSRPDNDLFKKAAKLPNGDIAFVTHTGRFIRVTPEKKEINAFSAAVETFGGRLEVLPNGHILIPLMSQNKVVEYTTEGKPVWEVNFDQPVAAVRLRNGHTLATSMNQLRAVEFNRDGKEVWDFTYSSRVTRAFRR